MTLLANGRFDDAKRAATAAVDREPGHPVASETLAIVRDLTDDMPAP